MLFEVLLDHGETANKCTIAPLRFRSDFQVKSVPHGQTTCQMKSPYILHPDGIPIESISFSNESHQIGAIDCIWRRLKPIIHKIEKPLPVLVKIPDTFLTAYPRRSKIDGMDPAGGLATIEALFIAAAFMGHWDPTLFAHYHFGAQFLHINREVFLRYGIKDIETTHFVIAKPQRNALQRKIARGRQPSLED